VIIGADVGGTFTDIVLVDRAQILVSKIPTSAIQSDAIVEGVDRLVGGAPVDTFIHGTTAATNALLERAGATVVLVTDTGFEDVIEIGRQDRPSLYDPFVDRSEPLVERTHRIGISLDNTEFVDIVGAESVAVALIDADIDPGREQRVADEVSAAFPGLPISISSVVSPEFREFERISTTVLNAYLVPITKNYMLSLEGKMVSNGRARSMAVMRSSGGLMSAQDAESSLLPLSCPVRLAELLRRAHMQQRSRSTRPCRSTWEGHQPMYAGSLLVRSMCHTNVPSMGMCVACRPSASTRSAPAEGRLPGSMRVVPCVWGPVLQGRSPVQPATGGEAPNQRSPMPTSCSAVSTRTRSLGERCR
jgi:hypothetical protein